MSDIAAISHSTNPNPRPATSSLPVRRHSAPRRLPWPATKIERDVLHELWREARATGQPITAIVKQAVDSYLTTKLEQPVASPEPAVTSGHPNQTA